MNKIKASLLFISGILSLAIITKAQIVIPPNPTGGTFGGPALATDGSCNPAAGGYAFTSQPGLAFVRAAGSTIDLCAPAYSATLSAMRWQGNGGFILGNGLGIAFTGGSGAGGTANFWVQAVAPVSGGLTFCTSPTVVNANGTVAFTINVGTACATSTGTITMSAVTTGYVASCVNITAPTTNVISQTGGTTTTITLTNFVRTTGVAGNWTDSNILRCTAFSY